MKTALIKSDVLNALCYRGVHPSLLKLICFIAVSLALSSCDMEGKSGENKNSAPPPASRPGYENVPAEELAYLEDPSLAALDTAKDTVYFDLLERYIVLEINRCRNDPKAWLQEVSLYGGECQIWADSLVDYTVPYRPPLEPRKGLWLAARWWSSEQKRLNKTSHANMNSRFSRYGTWGGSIGENCGPPGIEQQASGPPWFSSGGLGNARKYGARVVNEFIRDRGVSDKGHRMNIMSPNFHYVGIGVIDGWITMEFAQSYTDKPEAAQTDVWEP